MVWCNFMPLKLLVGISDEKKQYLTSDQDTVAYRYLHFIIPTSWSASHFISRSSNLTKIPFFFYSSPSTRCLGQQASRRGDRLWLQRLQQARQSTYCRHHCLLDVRHILLPLWGRRMWWVPVPFLSLQMSSIYLKCMYTKSIIPEPLTDDAIRGCQGKGKVAQSVN